MPINFDSALGIHTDALQIRSQRAELLASNLANADTPNYKARDIDFQTALKMASTGQSEPIKTTHQNHFSTSGGELFSPAVQYRQSMQDSLDGNTVDEQIEQSQFMQNAVQYQASLEFLGGKFRSIRSAIKGE
ncbi:flagellar basal-body rod protein FlgB [Methylophaga sp. 42_8_T64]|nr:flagellar basal-body rod protein FlgB [Methylophaga sp. 41_12_T18]OUR89497.1 flagellar basal-body rod protein FlgB [Methylophaga sp. 42_8_T64]